MLHRLLITLAGCCVIGVALLELRRQRLELLHDMASLHLEMDRQRKATWDLQYRIVEETSPPRLLAALDRLQIPTRPVPGEAGEPTPMPAVPVPASNATHTRVGGSPR